MFLKELKCNLQSGEFVVLCDFAENYSFVLQDGVQGFYWNNAQATTHPFVIYFKKSDTLNTEHENLVLIPDCLKHDSILVYTFRRHLMKFIENKFELPLKKIFTSLMGLQPNTKTEEIYKCYMSQRRLRSASRVALLCNIPVEECLLWGWWHSKKACSKSQFAVTIY
jgi:hypothetical protein